LGRLPFAKKETHVYMNSASKGIGGKTRLDAEELDDFTTGWRTVPISLLAMVTGVVCAYVALALLKLIGLFTNVFLPVIDGAGALVGVLTREDIRKRIEKEGEASREKRLRELVRSEVVEAYPDEPLRVVVYRVAENSITRMPVVEGSTGKLLGLVSLDDLLKARGRHLEEEKRREQMLQPMFFLPGGGVRSDETTASEHAQRPRTTSRLRRI
jgi:CBS domain-containing protein